jgi:hypothetical protein
VGSGYVLSVTASVVTERVRFGRNAVGSGCSAAADEGIARHLHRRRMNRPVTTDNLQLLDRRIANSPQRPSLIAATKAFTPNGTRATAPWSGRAHRLAAVTLVCHQRSHSASS